MKILYQTPRGLVTPGWELLLYTITLVLLSKCSFMCTKCEWNLHVNLVVFYSMYSNINL